MNIYIRDIILIGIYTIILILQLSLASYFIDKKNDIENILINYKYIEQCKDSAIYRLNNGSMMNNIIAIIISSSIIIGSFLMIILNKFISNRYEYESLDNNFLNIKNTDSIISRNLVPREKYNMAIQLIFIMGIICFVICNGIQFVLQLNNINDLCLDYINDRLDNFYVIYKFMTCISFMASFALIFIIPCFV
jgi:hypothetical protein